MNWTPEMVRLFNRKNPMCATALPVGSEEFENVFYSLMWWHENMCITDKIVLKLLPKLSPFH